MEFFKIFSLETVLSSVWSVNCFTSLTAEASFLARILLFPLFFAVGPTLSHFVYVYATGAEVIREPALKESCWGTYLCFIVVYRGFYSCYEKLELFVSYSGDEIS